MRIGFGEMLTQATVMADRLAARRSARPIVFLSDQPSELMPTLLRIGNHLSSQGHDIVIVHDPPNAGPGIEGLTSEPMGSPSFRLLLIPDIHQLNRRILARLLDDLHLVARDGLPVGCIATGSAETPKLVGELRSFAERLIEFRRTSVP